MQEKLVTADGADLYCEIRGHGPALLMISGAGGDAGYYGQVGDLLADAFTVIAYDRRANSRSTGSRVKRLALAEQADDAKAVIDALAGGRALVFGNSGGAIIGLELAARHPHSLVGLIAHEPPVVQSLPEGTPFRTIFQDILACVEREGFEAATARFIQTVRGEGGYEWPQDVLGRVMGNFEHLFRNEFAAFGEFVPDLEGLARGAVPIVMAAGSRDRGLYYARPSQLIAERMPCRWAELPGHHLAFMEEPVAFAAGLRALGTLLVTQTDGIAASCRDDSMATVN
jgi:pimeloyl-ACP methyl ester carboxylesterase